ncbi:hypothetical protein D3C71_78270 [compost metagenome]
MNTHDLNSAESAGEAQGETQHDNLAYAITDILRKAGHPRPEAWMQGLHPDTWTSNVPGIQRFHINRHWRVLIAEVESADSIDVRYCLVDTGKISDWLRLFQTGVAKWVVSKDLPRIPS